MSDSSSSVPSASDRWYYHPQSAASVDVNKTHPQPGISTSAMIGPTSTFYNPEDTSLQPGLDHGQYQQWIEGYGLQHQQQQQQQQQQQSHHHYSQQVVYNPNYHADNHGAHIQQMNPLYDYTQSQYEPSSSLSQYDGSTTGTVTQSNVGQNRDTLSSYQGQSNALYPQIYSENIGTKQSAASTSGQTPEVANYSYSTPLDQVPQQTLPQRSHQQQTHRKPPQPPQPLQVQQIHAQKFFTHPSSSEHRQHASSNPSSSRSSPLTPPSVVWNSKPGYSNPKPNANHKTQLSLTTASTNSGSSRTPTSQNNPATINSLNLIQFDPATLGVPEPIPPAHSTNVLSFSSEKTSHKRKRAKKNEPAQNSYGGESDSDSEGDGSNLGGGISVGMGGLGVVGKGVGAKVSRL